MEGQLEVIRSRRKTVSLEIRRDLTVVVRAPWHMSDQAIRSFLRDKQTWIEGHLAQAMERRRELLPPFTEGQLLELKQQATRAIPARVAWFAPAVGVSYGRVAIGRQISRWGSCSAVGNLNFNCLLMLCPPEVLDYVVVHELCHRKHMNHSRAFWAEVERVLPDYQMRRNWLKEHGGALVERLRPKTVDESLNFHPDTSGCSKGGAV